MTDVRGDYDRLAPVYAERLLGELAGKPLDRALLDCFAEMTRGRILEVGCGPGQVARYLAERGATVEGLDLSPEMVRIAAATHPGIRFTVGDMLALPEPDGALAGVVAFYAIVNFAPADLGRVAAELARVLAPGGHLLLSFHVGNDRVHRDELWGVPIALDFYLFETPYVEQILTSAGLAVEARLEREPVPDVEVQTRRAYLLARKP